MWIWSLKPGLWLQQIAGGGRGQAGGAQQNTTKYRRGRLPHAIAAVFAFAPFLWPHAYRWPEWQRQTSDGSDNSSSPSRTDHHPSLTSLTLEYTGRGCVAVWQCVTLSGDTLGGTIGRQRVGRPTVGRPPGNTTHDPGIQRSAPLSPSTGLRYLRDGPGG